MHLSPGAYCEALLHESGSYGDQSVDEAEARNLLVSLRRDLSNRKCVVSRIRIDLAVTGCNGELTYFVTTVAVYRRCKVVVTGALAGYV